MANSKLKIETLLSWIKDRKPLQKKNFNPAKADVWNPSIKKFEFR